MFSLLLNVSLRHLFGIVLCLSKLNLCPSFFCSLGFRMTCSQFTVFLTYVFTFLFNN